MTRWRKEQLLALVTFYYSFEGESWPQGFKDNWVTYDKPECYWFSSNHGSFGPDGSYIPNEEKFWNLERCNEKGKFQTLLLGGINLSNRTRPRVPPEISMLTDLLLFGAPQNSIAMSMGDLVSPQLFQMANLNILSLSGNTLTGKDKMIKCSDFPAVCATSLSFHCHFP